MPSAFALQVYGVTGRQQDGATLQQEMGDRNVPPPLIPGPAKPDFLAFLSGLCESLFLDAGCWKDRNHRERRERV